MNTTGQPAQILDATTLAEIARVRDSGALGENGRLRELFDLLAERSIAGQALKEAEIAVSVFGKKDATATRDDPVARVYIHRLRKRLDEFYLSSPPPDGVRIDIPRGEYRIIGRPIAAGKAAPGSEPDAVVAAAPDRWKRIAVIAACVLVLANIAAWAVFAGRGADPVEQARQSAVWSPITKSERPLLVVVGDYYMFGEYEDRLFLKRLIRDFSINSKDDLVENYLTSPREFERYADVALQYLPTSAAYALTDLMPVLGAGDRRVQVVLASELTPDRLKSSDIVFVGLFSGLGKLRDPVFAHSRFRFGDSYDEIVDRTSGNSYVSEAFLAAPGDTMYRDYGFFASFAGPSGNRIAVLSGTRDTALIGIAESLTNPDFLRRLRDGVDGARDFEALFEVKGQKQVSLETALLAHAPIDSTAIWSVAPGEQVAFPAQ